MPLRRATTRIALAALAASVFGFTPAHAEEAPGEGTAEVSVTAARFRFAEPLDVRVVDTNSTAVFDPTSAHPDARYARGEVTGVVLDGPEDTRLGFPSPPVASESRDGRDENSEGESAIAVPPERLRADADEIAAAGARSVNDMAFRHRDTGAEEDVDQGTVATGSASPARVVSVVDADEASVTANSEIADLTVLGGVSTLQGIGPGDHRSWAGTGEAGASADALKIASATILETGAALHLLGADADDVPDTRLAEMAEALGILPDLAGPIDGLGLPAPATAAELLLLLDTAGAAIRDQVVETVLETPLLALADTSGSVTSVASIAPNGEVYTAAASAGSVGTISVGTTELSGFDAAGTADDWNQLEAQLRGFLNTVTGSLGEAYEDTVMVRVMPRLVERTAVEDQVAVAESQISLLEVVVEPPSTPPEAPPTPDGGLLDDAPASDPSQLVQLEVGAASSGGGGSAGTGTVLGSAGSGGTRITIGTMEARATHTRPGVKPRCTPTCTDTQTLNRPWSPDAGFAAPGDAPDLITHALPETGADTAAVSALGALFILAAVTLRRWDPSQLTGYVDPSKELS